MSHPLLTFLLNTLFPPICPICQALMSDANGICPACFSKMRFITAPFCDMCGQPLNMPENEGTSYCPECLKKPKSWQRARAIVVYNDTSKQLILPFKHADKLQLIPILTRFMLLQKEFISEHDLIVPVPLHWRRMVKRRYNQSALIAYQLSKQTGIAFDPCALKRIRPTIPQGHLSPDERHRNVRDAFRVSSAHKIIGKRILLIDDVMTSGATATNCAKILLKNGATGVDVLTFAKALKHNEDTINEFFLS